MGNKSYKSSTSKILTEYCETNGLKATIETATIMLSKTGETGGKNFRATVNGELCETILILCIQDYIRRNKTATKNWFIEQGLILSDPNNRDSEYKTEIDVTLFTPTKIILFECKSYGGDKVLKEKCTVTRVGQQPRDVYSQHIKHAEAILKNFASCKIISAATVNKSGIMLPLFNFSIGSLKDYRIEKDKNAMPVYNTTNIFTLLNNLGGGEVVWNIPKCKQICRALHKTKKKDTADHLQYVKSLHHS